MLFPFVTLDGCDRRAPYLKKADDVRRDDSLAMLLHDLPYHGGITGPEDVALWRGEHDRIATDRSIRRVVDLPHVPHLTKPIRVVSTHASLSFLVVHWDDLRCPWFGQGGVEKLQGRDQEPVGRQPPNVGDMCSANQGQLYVSL